jgi:hypothetical protein
MRARPCRGQQIETEGKTQETDLIERPSENHHRRDGAKRGENGADHEKERLPAMTIASGVF